jgi:hypothetical protein
MKKNWFPAEPSNHFNCSAILLFSVPIKKSTEWTPVPSTYATTLSLLSTIYNLSLDDPSKYWSLFSKAVISASNWVSLDCKAAIFESCELSLDYNAKIAESCELSLDYSAKIASS